MFYIRVFISTAIYADYTTYQTPRRSVIMLGFMLDRMWLLFYSLVRTQFAGGALIHGIDLLLTASIRRLYRRYFYNVRLWHT